MTILALSITSYGFGLMVTFPTPNGLTMSRPGRLTRQCGRTRKGPLASLREYERGPWTGNEEDSYPFGAK